MPSLFNLSQGFSVRAFSKSRTKASPERSLRVQKGILRNNSTDSMTCSYCDQNNISGTDSPDNPSYRVACPKCSLDTDKNRKKRVRFDAVVRERNYIKAEEEHDSRKKCKKHLKGPSDAKVMNLHHLDTLYACNICKISMKTESEFIVHKRQHGINGAPVIRLNLPYHFQDCRVMSPFLFTRQ